MKSLYSRKPWGGDVWLEVEEIEAHRYIILLRAYDDDKIGECILAYCMRREDAFDYCYELGREDLKEILLRPRIKLNYAKRREEEGWKEL